MRLQFTLHSLVKMIETLLTVTKVESKILASFNNLKKPVFVIKIFPLSTEKSQ